MKSATELCKSRIRSASFLELSLEAQGYLECVQKLEISSSVNTRVNSSNNSIAALHTVDWQVSTRLLRSVSIARMKNSRGTAFRNGRFTEAPLKAI